LRLASNGFRGILDLAHPGEDPIYLLVEPHPVLSRREPALQSVKELQASISLKMRYELAHRRLRDVYQLGRAADATAFDHGLEGLDLA
jgi:hypothetical protein